MSKVPLTWVLPMYYIKDKENTETEDMRNPDGKNKEFTTVIT